MDLIVEAFSQTPHRRLIVIGDGPEMGKIRKLAGSNVTLMGYQGDRVLKAHLEKARAFVFAAEEDFGILPVEAQAAGAPVIAFGKGGALETVIPLDNPQNQPPTGLFFQEQTVESLLAALGQFETEESQFSPADIRIHAETFGTDRFLKTYSDYVKRKIEEFWPNRRVS
jgi:glycosyltransferase involved in cell wall biosynthesis